MIYSLQSMNNNVTSVIYKFFFFNTFIFCISWHGFLLLANLTVLSSRPQRATEGADNKLQKLLQKFFSSGLQQRELEGRRGKEQKASRLDH